jgi:rubrerythrin
MANTYFTFTLNLDDAPRVIKHCTHQHRNGDDTIAWRVDDAAIYFTGTPTQLLAFADSMRAAALDELTNDVYCQVCGNTPNAGDTCPVCGKHAAEDETVNS